MDRRLSLELRGYLIAILSVALAVLVRRLVDPLLGDQLPFVTLFCALAVAVWFGGYRPAVLASVVGFLACDYLFIPPRGALFLAESRDLVGGFRYVISCAVIIGLGEATRIAWRRVYEKSESLRITMASMGDAVITTDANGGVLSLNPVAVALTGWAEKEAIGQPLDTVFHIVNEQTRRSVENPALRALKEGKTTGLANHTILIARDGSEYCIDDSAAPIRDGKGNVSGVVLIFRDVTERRHSERSAQFLAAIVESSNDAIIGKDTNGMITSWNQAAERIFGYSAKEAVGRSIAMLAPPDRADEMPAILERIKRGEKVHPFDTVRQAKDGRLVPISLTVSPIRNEEGAIIGASKIVRDISERKRAEADLHEERNRLHATLTGIGDGVVVTDASGRVILMNPVGETLTGWKEEAIGRPLEDVFRIVNEETRNSVENPVHRVLREGIIVGLANHTVLIGKDGVERPIEDSAAPVRGHDGAVIGVVLVFRDASEHRASEVAMQRQQEILKLVHQIGKVGHWEWNSISDENKWSPEIEALYGLPPGAFGGTYAAWARLLHPDDLPKADEDVRRALETGRYFSEFRVIWPDGSVHWLEARAEVFNDGQGKPVRIMGVNMDITKRKEQEVALRAAKQELEIVTNAMSAPVTRCSRDFKYLWVNKPYAAWQGRTVAEIVDQPIAAIIGAQAFDELRPQFEQVLAGHVVRYEEQIHFEPIGARWINAVYTPVFDSSGAVDGWVAVVIDITERKQMEEALRHSEQRWHTMAEALPNLVWTDLPNGQCDWLSSQWGRYTGIPEKELLGLQWLEKVIHPDDRKRTLASWQAACADQAEYDLEYRIRRYDGEYHWFKTRGVPMRDEKGKITYWFGTCTDIEDLKRAQEILKDADRRKNEFLATLAHELRNPLAPIRNGLELIRVSKNGHPEIETARGMMERQLSQLVRLVDDLLDVSRITRGKVELHAECIDLAHVLQHAIETSRPLIETEGHQLELQLPPEPVFVHADFVRLAQIFSNLLNNAAKFTPEGGRIEVKAGRQGDEAVISIKDNGIGIAPEHLPKLFEMFSQLTPALERTQGGLGIGLTLSKGLVEMHGGMIEAHSDGPGNGSEFIVRLPVDKSARPAAPPAGQEAAPSEARFRILLVDDNRDTANTMAKLLRFLGHEIQAAYDGEEAVAAAKSFQPDVVLMDIGLPKLNGYEAARRIRAEPWGQEMTLIALTGWGQDEDRRRSQEAGFDHHLVKPIRMAAIEKLLTERTAK
ncbi:MAG TPA: PAS domain S-box protein [Gemmataceae bacterium]|nr:PAS domain S-box protein [Gemmataceae bacterium]